MSLASGTTPETNPAVPGSGLEPGIVRDYYELTKPRITGLVLVTAAAGFVLGSDGFNALLFLNTMIGIGLVAGGTSAMNQVLEHDVDALMARTRNRPVPAGRIAPLPAAIFSGILAGAGILYLASTVNLLTGVLAAATFAIYDFVYTPLKKVHSFSTVVGAIPGALPILGGWAAAQGQLSAAAWALFVILFFWQIPHFLALAWLLRKDYGAAGLRMLTVDDEGGARTRYQTLHYTVALVVASALPGLLGTTGSMSLVAALVFGAGFVWCAARFGREISSERARALFRYSILYLPALLLVLVLDKI